LKVLGAPLVSALRDRPLDAGKESVNYEQRLRRSMVSLLDGAVSLKYGAPEESARFLDEGLLRLRSRAVDADVRPDAVSLFNDSDTFEVERYLEDFMSVFAVLADVEAGKGVESLKKAIRRVDAESLKGKDDLPAQEVLTADLLERALSRTKSPMALYAVGRAVEAYALSLELSEDAKAISRNLLEIGRKAIADAKMATTPWLASRYPAFVRLVGESESKLAGPETYLTLVRQLRGQGRLNDAVAELKNAVRLYRENRDLWRLWVEVELAKAVEAVGKASTKGDALAGLADVIANGRANGAFSAADELYFNAVVDDRLGNVDRAIDQYLRAVREKNLDQVYRVRAKARLAVLRLKASRAEDVAQISGSK
jgi:tetratricopeptide (TPR) repeat protein